MKYLLLFTLFHSLLFAHDLKRIEAFMAINDAKEALVELKPILAQDKDNQELRQLELLLLAKSTQIPELIKKVKETKSTLPDSLLEEIAWATLRKSSESSSPLIRQEATLASFMANDAKGIPLCLQAMQDASEQMRLMSLGLATRCRDAILIEEAERLMLEDPSPKVRLQAISTIGAMRRESAKKKIEAILESPEATLQEKIACVEALKSIEKAYEQSRLEALATSDRALMRQLACLLVLEHLDKKNIGLIHPLLNDPSFDVRLASINCLGVIEADVSEEELQALFQHKDLKTQILGAWLALVKGKRQTDALLCLEKYLHSSDRQVRLFCAGAIAQSGPHGISFAKKMLTHHDDPLVRLNLAMGLIWERSDLVLASQQLLSALKDPMRLSWHSIGIFRFIGTSTSQHVGGFVRLPESQDLLLRLELYGMLATCPKTNLKDSLKTFLKERTWGISGQTAFLMIQEELLYVDELKELLKDQNREIALQAAFILAIFSQDEEALNVLQEAFPTASRQMKEYILYAIGTIGSKSTLPFLVQVLCEPFESLRISASRAILLSLYH